MQPGPWRGQVIRSRAPGARAHERRARRGDEATRRTGRSSRSVRARSGRGSRWWSRRASVPLLASTTPTPGWPPWPMPASWPVRTGSWSRAAGAITRDASSSGWSAGGTRRLPSACRSWTSPSATATSGSRSDVRRAPPAGGGTPHPAPADRYVAWAKASATGPPVMSAYGRLVPPPVKPGSPRPTASPVGPGRANRRESSSR